MNLYQQYASVNKRLARGESLYWLPNASALNVEETAGPDRRLLRYPRIGVYAGSGTSHSWLWFADLFERMGFLDVVFLQEKAVKTKGLAGLDILAVSGGDTFAVAEALANGYVPVYQGDTDNFPSVAIAKKLGFREYCVEFEIMLRKEP